MTSAGPIAPPPPRRRGRVPGGEDRAGSRRVDRLSASGPPPDGPGDDGGGGGDRGDGSGDAEWERARLGLFLALIGMTTLFGAFLIAYLLLRRNAPSWPPPGAPVPPQGLWISTVVIAASSATFVRAARVGRAEAAAELARWLHATLALGVVFLLVQAILWRDVFAQGRSTASDAYGTIFYSLTGLHAAHVIGGLVFLARTARRARKAPNAPRTRLALALCATYWHYMGGIWIVLFAVLYFLN